MPNWLICLIAVVCVVNLVLGVVVFIRWFGPHPDQKKIIEQSEAEIGPVVVDQNKQNTQQLPRSRVVQQSEVLAVLGGEDPKPQPVVVRVQQCSPEKVMPSGSARKIEDPPLCREIQGYKLTVDDIETKFSIVHGLKAMQEVEQLNISEIEQCLEVFKLYVVAPRIDPDFKVLVTKLLSAIEKRRMDFVRQVGPARMPIGDSGTQIRKIEKAILSFLKTLQPMRSAATFMDDQGQTNEVVKPLNVGPKTLEDVEPTTLEMVKVAEPANSKLKTQMETTDLEGITGIWSGADDGKTSPR